MRRVLRPILIVAGVTLAVGGLVLACAAYSTYFAYSTKVTELAANIPAEERGLPPAFTQAVARVHPQGVTSIVVRRLLAVVHPQPCRTLRYVYRGAVWTVLLPRTHSADEIMSLYAHSMVFEQGSGLTDAAAFYFGKSPRGLTSEEALSLVIIDLNPRAYSPRRHPERLKEALERYASGRGTTG